MLFTRSLLLSLLLLSAWPSPAQGQEALEVVAVTPTPNLVSASLEASIVITFNASVDPATFDDTSVAIFGRWSGVAQGSFQFEADHTRVRFSPERPFFAGEMVTVSLARQLATPGGTTLAHGYAWQFWTRPRPASLDLTETGRLPVRRPGEAAIRTYGAYAGDLNEDGYSDLALPNEFANDVRVFLNDGAGGYDTFTIYPIAGGNQPSPSEGADFDLDGHIDLVVGNNQNDVVTMFSGTGRGTFQPATNYTADRTVNSVAVLDLNGDGYMDVATANRENGTVALLLNEGDGTLASAEVINTPGSGETAIAAADANEDGLLDLFVGTFDSEDLLVLLADGEGGVEDHLRIKAGGASWMIATGDVNGDGHVDVVSANSLQNNASVLLGDGQGNLTPAVTYPTGGFPLAIDLGDLDGDGDLDLVTSNFEGRDWTLYENRGDGTYTNPRSLPATSAGSCAILHDRDNNGTLDLTGIDERTDELFFFTNSVATNTEPDVPAAIARLHPAYPSPFFDKTTIPFSLDQARHVRLVIYDALGHTVRTVLDERRAPGDHQAVWDGRNEAGRPIANGLYFIRLESARQLHTQRVLYLSARR